jgi:hypothetical protein
MRAESTSISGVRPMTWDDDQDLDDGDDSRVGKAGKDRLGWNDTDEEGKAEAAESGDFDPRPLQCKAAEHAKQDGDDPDLFKTHAFPSLLAARVTGLQGNGK